MTTRCIVKALLILTIAAPSGLSFADTPVMRRSGEWALTMNNGLIPQSTVHVCYNADKPVAEIPINKMKDCTRNDVSVSGGVITVDAACSMPNTMKITVHATILPVGPDAFHSESEMRLDNPPPGVPTMKMVIDARRIGDTCQPGETPLQ